MTVPFLYHFTVPGIPRPKERARTVRNRRTGRSITYTPQKTQAYEAKVRFHALQCRMRSITADVVMSLNIYLPDRRRRDADNIIKAIKDGLNGVAYRDDSQVKEGHWSMHLDPGNPRVEVWVGEVAA